MIFDIFSKYPHILNCKLRLEIHLKRVFCRRQRQDNERKIQTLYGVRYQLVIAALLSVTYGLNVHILNIFISGSLPPLSVGNQRLIALL